MHRISPALLATTLVLLATLVLAQSRERVTTINGGRTTLFLEAPTFGLRATAPGAGLVTIYSNLGTGNNVYNGIAGNGVLGRDVPGQPRPEWLAFAFTPAADHTVTEIQVGVTNASGTNSVVLSFNQDAGGIPGAALQTWHFTSLPTFGSCCTLQTAKSKSGISVKAGTQYWVVLENQAIAQDTWDVWNYDSNNAQGVFSNNTGQGWQAGGIQQQGAFGVFGK
jgi:hypothetical protein